MRRLYPAGPAPEVAPLTGSVDRNDDDTIDYISEQVVAPLTGSVDRNSMVTKAIQLLRIVAPLTGSVDRNNEQQEFLLPVSASLPSRGAWIEIKALKQRFL